jgi:shikimate kinase
MIKNKLILLGGMPASGKTTIGKKISAQLKIPFLDKDTLCDIYTNFIVERETYPNDRSSDLYTKKLRNIEYEILFHVAMEQVSLGLCPILVAPFSTEFKDVEKMKALAAHLKSVNTNYSLESVLLYASPEKVKKQIKDRNRQEDSKKIELWESYIKDKIEFQERAKLIVKHVVSDTEPEIHKKIISLISN